MDQSGVQKAGSITPFLTGLLQYEIVEALRETPKEKNHGFLWQR
jgi:hypothetical protein